MDDDAAVCLVCDPGAPRSHGVADARPGTSPRLPHTVHHRAPPPSLPAPQEQLLPLFVPRRLWMTRGAWGWEAERTGRRSRSRERAAAGRVIRPARVSELDVRLRCGRGDSRTLGGTYGTGENCLPSRVLFETRRPSAGRRRAAAALGETRTDEGGPATGGNDGTREAPSSSRGGGPSTSCPTCRPF